MGGWVGVSVCVLSVTLYTYTHETEVISSERERETMREGTSEIKRRKYSGNMCVCVVLFCLMDTHRETHQRRE